MREWHSGRAVLLVAFIGRNIGGIVPRDDGQPRPNIEEE
jgi:hypothetical protein